MVPSPLYFTRCPCVLEYTRVLPSLLSSPPPPNGIYLLICSGSIPGGWGEGGEGPLTACGFLLALPSPEMSADKLI